MLWISTVSLLSSLLLVGSAQEMCDDGWIQFEDMRGNGLCILMTKEPATWDDARKFCAEKIGSLMDIDKYGDLTYFKPSEEGSTNFGRELVQSYSIEEFWSGLYVDRGRLYWDDYGPRLVERAKFSFIQSWSWGAGQPDPKAGFCGKASVIKRQTDEGVSYNYYTVSANLTDCSTRLPFVCKKVPTKRVVKTAAFCPNNWLGNQYIPHCFRIYKEPVTYDKANERCQEEGSDIAPSSTAFDLIFADIVFGFYSQNDKYFEVTNIRNIWLKDTNTTRQCTALNTTQFEGNQGNQPSIADVNCLQSLLFMCVKLTKFAGAGYIETKSDYFDQKTLLEYLPFEPLPVYGVLDRNLQENEVIFVQTPSFILNSSNSYFQWNFDNAIVWRVIESSIVSVPYYVNITLPSEIQQPSRRRRGFIEEGITDEPVIDPPERFINYDNVRVTTGYYTFGIYHTNPPRYLARKPQLVRYSEKDLFIYVAYCDMVDNVIGPSSTEPLITIEDVNSFNLLKDVGYIGEMREIGLGTILFSTPDILGNLVAYYYTDIEAIENNKVKFRTFIAPIARRGQPANFEQFVYDALNDHYKTNLPIDYFKLNTLEVKSTVMCPFTQIEKDGKNLTFNAIKVGQTGYSWERCYPNNTALATSVCKGGYDDGTNLREISLATNCGSVPVYNESESTNILKNLSETKITRNNFEKVINDTVNLTNPDLNITEADVIYTAEILYNYLQFDIVNTPEVMETVFKIVDNVLNSGTDVIDTAQKITNAANRIILSVDELTNEIGLLGDVFVQFIQDYVASEVWEQTGDTNLTIGINFNQTGAKVLKKEALNSVKQPGDVSVTGTDTAIYLTESLVKGGRTRLTFHIYANTDLFSVISSRPTFKMNSKVAAARLTKNNKPIVDLGDEVATSVFYPFEDSNALKCAYWNYSANEEAGGWNTTGCTTLFSKESGRVVCKCNHLTNFAVLIDLEAGTIDQKNKLVLGIITKVGLCISIAGLGITVLTFLMFKHLRNGRGQQVLVNLSVAMLCSSILFLVGVDRTESYTGCIVVSVLLHYFILVTFMWMLVEGVLQYLRFVKVLGTYIPNFMIKSMIPAWGIPLIPVIIVLAIDYNMYYGGNGYCWLSWTPFLYAFLIPIAVIIVANMIVFFMVMYNLCCRRKHKGMVSNQSERKKAFLHFRAGISILVILGLTWVFGFLTVDNTRIVFHYLFAIFNAFQGFFIFLLFTSREKRIRNAWRKLCCKKSAYKSSTSGTDSHPRKQSSDATNSTGLLNKSNKSNMSGGSNSKTTNGDRNFSNDNNIFNNPHYGNAHYDNGI